MPKATRYPCSVCGQSFVLDFFLQQDSKLCCLICNGKSAMQAKIVELCNDKSAMEAKFVELCNGKSAMQAEIVELKQEIALLKDELLKAIRPAEVRRAVEDTGESQNNASTVVNSSDDGYSVVRRGSKSTAPRKAPESASVTLQNRFAVLEEEAEPEPDVMLVGDSLVRGQGDEFCRMKRSRKFRCYPGQKIEDITERVDYLVENSTEDSMFVTVVGTNNLRCDRETDIVDKYRIMIREFASRRRKVAVCGIIPRYDVGPAMFRKMSVVNREVAELCKQKNMHFFDLWHHFCRDRTLYARDGIHLNCVGKARLGRVIGECLADIPRTPGAENGNTSDDTASATSEETVNRVAGNSHTAPDSVLRQEEEEGMAEVPTSIGQCSTDKDFQ